MVSVDVIISWKIWRLKIVEIASSQTESKDSHGGERIARVLQAHGVKFLFTLCGGHISPILTACKSAGIRVVDVRHEATAVFAADAVGRLTGVPGIAAVTAGPGLTNSLTALKNAQLAQSPLILLGGAAPTALQGKGALQDIDQRPVVAPHVKSVKQIRTVRDIYPVMEEAFALALDGIPGPIFVECPVDVLYSEENVRQWYQDASNKGDSFGEQVIRSYLNRHVNNMFAGKDEPQPPLRGIELPLVADTRVELAIEIIAKAERPILVVGSQALSVPKEAQRVAAAVARLGIPVYLSGMARGLLGRDSGLQLRHQRRQALRESDCVVLAGVPCDFRLDYGRHVRGSAKLITVNRSRKEARMNRRPDLAAVGDVGQFLEHVSVRLTGDKKLWQPWLDKLRERENKREEEIETEATVKGDFVNPIALLKALDAVAPNNSVLVADGGDFVATASYVLHARTPLSWLDPGVFGTLGVGAGFALGAALCRPNSEIWLIYGDGACGYGLVEFDTFVRHGIPVIALVGNDAGWTQIAREQVKLFHDNVGTVLRRTAYDAVVEGFGAVGILLKDQTEIEEVFSLARAHYKDGKPVLINAWINQTDFREGSISM